MKTYIALFTLFLFTCSSLLAKNLKDKSNKDKIASDKEIYTPKGADLKNHFGLNSKGMAKYGKFIEDHWVNEEVQEMYDKIDAENKDVKGSLTNEFKSNYGHMYSSGSLSNIADNASKIIDPDIIGKNPSYEIKVEYPKILEVNQLTGYKNTKQPITAYDKKEKQIIDTSVVVKTPIYEKVHKILSFPTSFKVKYNLDTHKAEIINTQKEQKMVKLGEK